MKFIVQTNPKQTQINLHIFFSCFVIETHSHIIYDLFYDCVQCDPYIVHTTNVECDDVDFMLFE